MRSLGKHSLPWFLAFAFAFSPALAGDWPEGIRAAPTFSKLQEATIVNWTVTNTGDAPLAPGGIRIHYTCGNAEVEVITHEYMSTILPGASTSDGDHFLCVAKHGVASLFVETPAGGSSGADKLIYLMPCDRAAEKQVELTWNAKGFYNFETEDGVKGVVARAILDDATLMKTACGEFGPPQGEMQQRVKDWFRGQIFSRPGDTKQGYTDKGHTGTRG